MNIATLKQLTIGAACIVSAASLSIVPASALANKAEAGTTTAGTAATKTSANDQAKLSSIISRGNNEISRRLTTLNGLSAKISAASKLSAGDKSSLSAEVSTEISGLNNLKTKLDADTDVTTARSDAQSIFNDYRVYALIVPKVNLVKTADDQQVAETKFTTLAGKLQTRIDSSTGKDTASLQTKLNDLKSQVSAAQAISNQIESGVINLQPSDYNSNHSVLSGDRDQLKKAQADLKAAGSDAQAIISALKS